MEVSRCFTGAPLSPSVGRGSSSRANTCVAAASNRFRDGTKYDKESDVVIVGAGIIGLSIARQLLLTTPLSVSIVDAKRPCAGATGAGQGSIWMGYRTPDSDNWGLVARSKHLWEEFVQDIESAGLDPLTTLGWKTTGSVLVGTTADESLELKQRVDKLNKAGVRAEFFSGSALQELEPALDAGKDGAAALVPNDSQIDAKIAASFILQNIRLFSYQGRYTEFFDDPVLEFARPTHTGEIGVRTLNNTLHATKAVVIAAGAWSRSLAQRLSVDFDFQLDVPVRPRKGHVLVVKRPPNLQINHGLMELGYSRYQIASVLPESSTTDGNDSSLETLSVSMAATTDPMGNLVLGSSRQFSGFNCDIEKVVVESIIKRAADFFPALKKLSVNDVLQGGNIRVGLRPYMPDGKPVIGSVPNFPNLFLATGHEGAGLCMALGTAEAVADMVMGNEPKIDVTPFLPQGRCCN